MRNVSIGAKLFVGIVFFSLGLSFFVTTGVFLYEFYRPDTDWLALIKLYSHLFLFFPTLGIVALFAFYFPSSVFVDLYWRHVPWGKVRFIIGSIMMVALSWLLATQISGGAVPTIWQIHPTYLNKDKGEPAGCNTSSSGCKRLPIMTAVQNLSHESTQRLGLSKFVRKCHTDPLLPPPDELNHSKYCFANGQMSNARQCCQAQQRFSNHLKEQYKNTTLWSLTGKVHILLLPLKVFFLLILLTVGLLLAFWRKRLETLYAGQIEKMEKGILLGALVMVFWPATNHAFVQSSQLLYGNFAESFFVNIATALSFLFGIWALALLFFFYRHRNLEALGKGIGVATSFIAFLKYDEIIDYATRIAGSGADLSTMIVMAIIILFAFFPIVGKIFPKARK